MNSLHITETAPEKEKCAEPAMAKEPETDDAGPPKDLKVELERLAAHQNRSKCKEDVSSFLRPYINECIRRVTAGEDFISLPVFLKQEGVCDLCYHQDFPHSREHCRQTCCKKSRCGTCMHDHYGRRCPCAHTEK